MLKLNTNNTLKLIGKLFSFPKSELPHCLIEVQWGILSNVQQSITINFPISFVNNIFSITASHATSQYEDLVITTISKTGAVFYGRGVQQGQTRYIAIGV